MEITAEAVTERLRVAREDRDQTLRRAQALDGVIQDCEHWLSVLDQPEEGDDG